MSNGKLEHRVPELQDEARNLSGGKDGYMESRGTAEEERAVPHSQ